MIVRNLIVALLIVKTAQCIHLEPIDFLNVESFDGVRGYPAFKLIVTPITEKKFAKMRHDEIPRKHHMDKNKSARIIVSSASSASESSHDKVRDFNPMSRDDIRKLKKLSFHGRAPPKNASHNSTTSPSTSSLISSSRPTQSTTTQQQIDYNQKRKQQHQHRPTKTNRKSTVAPKLKSSLAAKENRKRAASSSKHEPKAQKTSDVSFPKNIDKGFIPLLKPSPINVHSPSAPSFHTMRNYQDYLKQRQKIFFEALEKEHDDDGRKADVRDETPARDVETEIDYFTKREQELADEQRPKAKKSQSYKKDKATDSSTKRRSSGENDSAEEREESSREEETASDDSSSVEMDDESTEEHGGEEETKKYENFVPFKMYAQVRHIEAENHRPKDEADEPNVKEKLSLEKKNVYYKEEGYDEKKYDHGKEHIDADYKRRTRRSIESGPTKTPETDEHQQSLQPMALALIKKSDLANLTGAKLFHHLDELIANSSIVLADDDYLKTSGSDPSTSIIYGTRAGFKHNEKFPFYSAPDTDTLNTMSAYRYAENSKNFPNNQQSLYDFKQLNECDEIDEEIDPVPQDIEVKGKSTSFNEKPKRLKNLGGKINCFKKKIFGKDPFDNPLFKEEYVAASIPIPLRETRETARIPHQVNPLIAVYDDVIANIRSSFADDLKAKQKEKEIGDSSNAESSYVENTSFRPNVRLYDLSAAPGVSRLPMFDINNFLPRFKARPIGLDDDVEDFVKTSKRNVRPQDYEMEFIESKPKNGKFTARDAFRPSESAIANLRPPIPTNKLLEKRKRRNPIPLQITITRIYPSKSSSSKTSPSKYLQPPSIDKFRIL